MSQDHPRRVHLVVLVAALGYFVDIYDLVLFSVLRTDSLLALGVASADLQRQGTFLLEMQMYGMLLGGIVWGVLGDRRGRRSVLFGSILLYSLANIANAFVHSVPAYAAWRFVAGLGLAGELGAGVTLVAELMRKETRGYGTTLVAGVGVCGAVVAALVKDVADWRTAYVVGGILGLGLLLLRIGTFESGLFEKTAKLRVSRGNFFLLFSPWRRLLRYVCVVAVALPIWFVVGILITFAREIGPSLGMTWTPDGARAILFCYAGLAVGDVASGWLSQVLKTRRKVICGFLALNIVAITSYFWLAAHRPDAFYLGCFAVGIGGGYWAVFMTLAAEQFGTNIRATVATTAPNFVRGAVPLMTNFWKGLQPSFTQSQSAMIVGAVILAVAFLAWSNLEETYGKELDYSEGAAERSSNG